MFNIFKKKELAKNLKPGDNHYRAFIGPPEKYDLVSSMQFNLMTKYGLRENHKFLDIGCGSLRGGRLFIVYLLENRYYGVEPEKWLVRDGIKYELGSQIIRMKKPKFLYQADFCFNKFGVEFDFSLAQSIFTHASAKQIDTCLRNLKLCAGKDFKLLASYIDGNSDYSGDEWVYPGCVSYTFNFMREVSNRNGFECIKLDESHPNNHSWVMIKNK